jgi:hypothetical protein
VRPLGRVPDAELVRASTPPPPALQPSFAGPQHLVTLASVEDDGLGEELQVVWARSYSWSPGPHSALRRKKRLALVAGAAQRLEAPGLVLADDAGRDGNALRPRGRRQRHGVLEAGLPGRLRSPGVLLRL